MPQIPYQGAPQVGPQYASTPSARTNISAGTLGAGVAAETGRLGGALAQAGNELFSRAIAMEQLDQQADALNAHAAASDAIGKRIMDYRTLSGRSAKDGYEPFVSDIDKIIETSGENLSSPYAKHLYAQEVKRLRQYTVDSAGAHAGTEFKNYLIGTEQSKIDVARNNIGLHPDDDVAFRDNINSIDASASMMKTLKGWSDEQAEDYRNTQRSKASFERAINLARTNPQRAQGALDEAVKSGYISGEDAGRAGTFIRNQRNQVMTRVESGSLLAGEGGHFGTGVVNRERMLKAVSAIEGGGNYEAVHPLVTKGKYKGQRALGLYGIMPGNLSAWLSEAGMKPMTPAEFVKDHKAQDDLAWFKLNQYQEQHGSANKAAMVWFTGAPEPDASANDGHTSAPEYLKRFNAALGKSATSSEVETVASSRAQELVPDDDEFHFGFRDRVLAEHRRDRQIEREEEYNRRQIIDEAIVPDRDGKLVTSIEDIPDPKVHEAWDNLSASARLRYQKLFAQNAKGDYAPTEQNQASYHQWLGRLTDPQASDEDRQAALDADYATMPMPANQRQQLIGLRSKMLRNADRNPALGHAMQTLAPMLNEAGITKKEDEEAYYQFLGTLGLVIEQKQSDTGKPLKDEEIRTIGAGLLRQQAVGGWWGKLWGSTEPAFEAEVPEAERAKIIREYSAAKGFDPTNQTIQQIYAAHQYNNFYAKQTGTESKFKRGGL